MSLSVEHLSFSYEKQLPILKDISFEVSAGQFIGIFGPNGGGKTTLLKLLLGLLKPTSGSIEILDTTPEHARGVVSYVPQVRRFDKQFPISAIEVVLQGCLASHKGWGGFSSEAKSLASQALADVGLADKEKAAFGTLSGGQIQRTLLARALVSQPKVLLLDEATVGVDPTALQEIVSILLSLRKKMTILMVTHDLQMIAREMDKLFCINKTITPYTPEEVCGHFAMGLYHPKGKDSHD